MDHYGFVCQCFRISLTRSVCDSMSAFSHFVSESTNEPMFKCIKWQEKMFPKNPHWNVLNRWQLEQFPKRKTYFSFQCISFNTANENTTKVNTKQHRTCTSRVRQKSVTWRRSTNRFDSSDSLYLSISFIFFAWIKRMWMSRSENALEESVFIFP